MGVVGSKIKCLARKNGENRLVGALGSKIKCIEKQTRENMTGCGGFENKVYMIQRE